MDLYEALYTTRAMRRVKPDPIPADVTAVILDAAVRAPSGGNTQNWRFVVVTDPELRAGLGPLYRAAWQELQETLYQGRREAAAATGDDTTVRVLNSAQWLADNFEQVPMWLLAFSRNDPSGASIYPAVWSAMLAARGRGVGTCLTTVLSIFKQVEVFELLDVPSDRGWTLNAAVSCGYPLGRWGTAPRRPAHEIAYSDRWGEDLGFRIDRPLWSQ